MGTEQIQKYAITAAIVVIVVVILFNWNTFREWVHIEPIPETS